MPAQSSLHITHICLLRVIADHPDSKKSDLWLPKGHGLWNQYLRSSGLVRRGYCTPVTAARRFTDAIATLHLCGYLREDTERYQISDYGITLFYSLASHPSMWPLTVQLSEDGSRLWETACYFTKK